MLNGDGHVYSWNGSIFVDTGVEYGIGDNVVQRNVIVTATNYESLGISTITEFPKNMIYGIGADITEEMISGLPSYGSYATLITLSPTFSTNGFTSYIFIKNESASTNDTLIYFAWCKGESEGVTNWTTVPTASMLTALTDNCFKSSEVLNAEKITEFGISDFSELSSNKVYGINFDVTEEVLTGLPEYGTFGTLVSVQPSFGSSLGFTFYLYVTQNNFYFNWNGGSLGLAGWKKLYNNSDPVIAGDTIITASNYSTLGITSLDSFTPNKIYGIGNDITSEMITGLPVYEKYATLTLLKYDRSNVGFTTAIYTTNGESVYDCRTFICWQSGSVFTDWTEINANNKSNYIKNLNGAKVVLCGDSICAGAGGTGYAKDGRLITTYDDVEYYANDNGQCWANSLRDYLIEYYNCECVNNGIGGWSFYRLYKCITDIVPPDTDIAIIYLGINNRSAPTHIQAYMGYIIHYFKQNNIQPIFLTPINALDDNTKDEYLVTSYEINNLVQTACATYNLPSYNLQSELNFYLTDHDMELTTDIMPDSLHPNDTLHQIMFKLIKKLLGV